jgi:kynurenine formamidase
MSNNTGAIVTSRSGQQFPSYDSLPSVDGTDEHFAWELWGAGDELGAVNRLSPDTVIRATDEVVTGEVISLSLPLDQPGPGLFEGRDAYERHEIRTSVGREDSITNLDLQFSSQWDGFRHVRHRRVGYYGGRSEEDLDAGALGIQLLAERGLVARGVLVDIPAYFAANGIPYRPDRRIALESADLQKILDHQGVKLDYGDVLVIRTGWIDWYLSLSPADRRDLRGTVRSGEGAMECPGLRGTIDTARWLWNSGIAAVAADNPTVEALPVIREDGFLHRRVLPLLGMPFGELWSLKSLSALCYRRKKYSFLLTSAPLNITSGVASPANALAIL